VTLFTDADERHVVTIAVAAISLHALLTRPELDAVMSTGMPYFALDGPQMVAHAFDIAELFIAEAEKRYGSKT
jgi:hypothetical protein